MSLLDQHPDTLYSTDKPNISDSTEQDLAAFASTFYLERGYPVMYTDHYALQTDILKKAFNHDDNSEL